MRLPPCASSFCLAIIAENANIMIVSKIMQGVSKLHVLNLIGDSRAHSEKWQVQISNFNPQVFSSATVVVKCRFY